jgi:uncharacterized protein (DUF58 family)
MSRRHLVLCVFFKDEYIEHSRRELMGDVRDLFRVGAAADLEQERARALETLRRSGTLVLEAGADTLSSSVVNRYLDVKAARLI